MWKIKYFIASDNLLCLKNRFTGKKVTDAEQLDPNRSTHYVKTEIQIARHAPSRCVYAVGGLSGRWTGADLLKQEKREEAPWKTTWQFSVRVIEWKSGNKQGVPSQRRQTLCVRISEVGNLQTLWQKNWVSEFGLDLSAAKPVAFEKWQRILLLHIYVRRTARMCLMLVINLLFTSNGHAHKSAKTSSSKNNKVLLHRAVKVRLSCH